MVGGLSIGIEIEVGSVVETEVAIGVEIKIEIGTEIGRLGEDGVIVGVS